MKTLVLLATFALCVPVSAETFKLSAQYDEPTPEPPKLETCDRIIYPNQYCCLEGLSQKARVPRKGERFIYSSQCGHNHAQKLSARATR
jgi:hypothetical protein